MLLLGTAAFTGIPFLTQPTQPTVNTTPNNNCLPGNQAPPATGTNLGTTGGGSQSFSAGGLQVALGDGSVRSVAPSISPTTWARAVNPTDGNVLNSDWNQ